MEVLIKKSGPELKGFSGIEVGQFFLHKDDLDPNTGVYLKASNTLAVIVGQKDMKFEYPKNFVDVPVYQVYEIQSLTLKEI